MDKSFKKGIGFAIGIAAVGLTAYAAYKVIEDINTIVDDDKSFGKKTQEWFAEKRKYFKALIEEKNQQIEKISAKLKEDVIKEIDEAKRRDLVEKATRKIAKLKEDIKSISAERRDEFLYYMRKMGATNIANVAYNAGINIKKAVEEKFTSEGKPPVTDMDFDYEEIE